MRAAERLNLSQSALSVQLGKLELQLGHPLFDRTGKRLILTEAGRIPALSESFYAIVQERRFPNLLLADLLAGRDAASGPTSLISPAAATADARS